MQIHVVKIKADILCELIAVSVIRSEFNAAEMVGFLLSMLPQNPEFSNRKRMPSLRTPAHGACLMSSVLA